MGPLSAYKPLEDFPRSLRWISPRILIDVSQSTRHLPVLPKCCCKYNNLLKLPLIYMDNNI